METEIKPYVPGNGVKNRFDGCGSEFGKIHRHLPKQFGMFDIDRMQGKAIVDLELIKQDIAFIEYRTNWDNVDCKWIALFEIKFKDSKIVQEQLQCKTGTASFAQMCLCRALGMRYFFVIANEGEQPFRFYEINTDTGQNKYLGLLQYNTNDILNKNKTISYFWYNVLNIKDFPYNWPVDSKECS